MIHKIVAICGSPIKDGNTATLLDIIMNEAAEKGHQTNTFNLSQLNIKNCKDCNYCFSKQKPGKYCALNDDAQAIFEQVESSDIIILASPVYFMRTSGLMATLIDRLRIFIYGNLTRGKLRNKIGMSAGVSWYRNAGLEMMHLTHLSAFLHLDMIPALTHASISPMGAGAFSSINGTGKFDPEIHIGVKQDKAGLETGSIMLARAIELADLTRAKS